MSTYNHQTPSRSASPDPLQFADPVPFSTPSCSDWSPGQDVGLGGHYDDIQQLQQQQPQQLELSDMAGLEADINYFYKLQITRSCSEPELPALHPTTSLSEWSTNGPLQSGGPSPVEFGSSLLFSNAASRLEETFQDATSFGNLEHVLEGPILDNFEWISTAHPESMQLDGQLFATRDLALTTPRRSESAALAPASAYPDSASPSSPRGSSRRARGRSKRPSTSTRNRLWCDMCDNPQLKGFQSQKDLKRHQLVHMPERARNRFPCPISHCSTMSTRSDNRLRHIRGQHKLSDAEIDACLSRQ